jgi:hypothetical protein
MTTNVRYVLLVFEQATLVMMAQLGQRLRLDLPRALARDAKRITHHIERASSPIDDAETQLDHFPLAGREDAQRFPDALA